MRVTISAKNDTKFAVFFIIIAITIYTLPLLLNIDRSLTLSRKNQVSICYQNYIDAHFYFFSILKNHKPPLWSYFFEGGVLWISVPDEISFNPFSFLVLLFGVFKGINLSYYLLYVLGALSMFYLAKWVFNYDLFGAIYSALVFSMCGFFPLMQSYGFVNARETILLPLLTALFLKSVHSNRYILPTSLLLSLFLAQSALYFPIVVLFLFMITILNSFHEKNNVIFIKKRYLAVFFISLTLCLCISAFKLLMIFEFLSVDSGHSGQIYSKSVITANTLTLFLERLLRPKNSGTGTIYIGYLPSILCLFSGVILFKKLKRWLLILVVFIMLSFGSNSFIDLHYFLWHLPIFNAIDEVAKYYSLIIVFLISLLAGGFFVVIRRFLPNLKGIILCSILIFLTYTNLLFANSPYFNEYKTDLLMQKKSNNFSQAKLINIHNGDEGGMPVIAFSLYQNNIGVINQGFDRYVPRISSGNICPKYLVMPKYVFLSPSTKLITMINPAYESEAYFLHKKNKAELVSLTQDAIRIRVHVKSKDRLVINQNYSNWWRSKQTRIENYKGLLSMPLEKLGDYEVQLCFFPLNFYLGVLVSCVALIFCVCVSRFVKFRLNSKKADVT